ncbi:MAG: NAD(P)H-dependent oxidoreductase [Thermoleophilia bacterium]
MSRDPFRVLAVPGSLRSGSLNRRLLETVAERAPEDVEIVLYDGLGGLPHFDADLDTRPGPEAVEDLRARMFAADGILIATPEYNSSIPGVLKNALDWASRPYGTAALVGRPAAVVGVSPSAFGAVWAAAEVRKVLTASGARVVDAELGVKKADSLVDEHGRFDDATVDAVLGLVAGLREVAAEAAAEAEADAALA